MFFFCKNKHYQEIPSFTKVSKHNCLLEVFSQNCVYKSTRVRRRNPANFISLTMVITIIMATRAGKEWHSTLTPGRWITSCRGTTANWLPMSRYRLLTRGKPRAKVAHLRRDAVPVRHDGRHARVETVVLETASDVSFNRLSAIRLLCS